LGIRIRWRVALVALLAVWILGRIALLRLSILRIWVCDRCRGSSGRCGRSCGSGLVLIIGVICNRVLISTRNSQL
jgi:hypothetical protein